MLVNVWLVVQMMHWRCICIQQCGGKPQIVFRHGKGCSKFLFIGKTWNNEVLEIYSPLGDTCLIY